MQLQQLKLEKLRRKGLEDFYFFAKHILGNKDMSEQPHQELCNMLIKDTHNQKLVLLPRGSFKSSVANVAFSLWNIVKNKNIRILMVTGSFTNATKYLGQIKDHIEKNNLLKTLYGDLKPKNIGKWKRDDITIITRDDLTIKEPTVTANSILQTKTGMHYDLIILDDVVTEENSNTPDQLNKIIDRYRLILSLPDPGSTLVIIGTRYHYNDLYGHIIAEEPEYWDILVRKATSDEGELYFPSRLTKEMLFKLKKSQGSSHFSNQYQNEPIDSETALFRLDWIHYYSELPGNLRHFILTDAAASLKKTADYSVVITIGVDEHSNVYVVDAWRGRVTLSEFINKIFEKVIEYNVHEEGTVTVETNAFQQAIKYMLCDEMEKREFYFGLTEMKPDSTHTKSRRIQAMQPYFENKKVFLGTQHSDLVEEITRYPKTRYDDLVDALSDFVQVIFPADKLRKDKYDGKLLTSNEKKVWEGVDKHIRSVRRNKNWNKL